MYIAPQLGTLPTGKDAWSKAGKFACCAATGEADDEDAAKDTEDADDGDSAEGAEETDDDAETADDADAAAEAEAKEEGNDDADGAAALWRNVSTLPSLNATVSLRCTTTGADCAACLQARRLRIRN